MNKCKTNSGDFLSCHDGVDSWHFLSWLYYKLSPSRSIYFVEGLIIIKGSRKDKPWGYVDIMQCISGIFTWLLGIMKTAKFLSLWSHEKCTTQSLSDIWIKKSNWNQGDKTANLLVIAAWIKSSRSFMLTAAFYFCTRVTICTCALGKIYLNWSLNIVNGNWIRVYFFFSIKLGPSEESNVTILHSS